MELLSIGTPLLWTGCMVFVLVMLAQHQSILGERDAHRVCSREGN